MYTAKEAYDQTVATIEAFEKMTIPKKAMNIIEDLVDFTISVGKYKAYFNFRNEAFWKAIDEEPKLKYTKEEWKKKVISDLNQLGYEVTPVENSSYILIDWSQSSSEEN